MAGSSQRVFNFCNSQPTPCKCLNICPTAPPTPPPLSDVELFLKNNNEASGAPFSACTYGNAFTGKEIFAGYGNARQNASILNGSVPVNKDTYWRYASMTKSMGMTVLAAALEDGYVTSLDDPVSKYISQFNKTDGTYVNFNNVTSLGGFDAYGTPTYSTGALGTVDYNMITIRHLITATAGFGYNFLGSGALRSVLNTLPNPNDSGASTSSDRNTYIAWLQYIENNFSDNNKINADLLASYYNAGGGAGALLAAGDSGNNNNNNNNNKNGGSSLGMNGSVFSETFTELIINRITSIPLLFYPGTQTLYDISTTIIGGVVGRALQMNGINKTSAQYLQSRVLSPLGITSMWFNCGSSNPPEDASFKLADAFFVRNNNFVPATDPAGYTGPNPVINTKGSGNYVQTNELYRSSDMGAVGDGFVHQSINAMFATSPANADYINDSTTDYLAGGYDWSGCGTMTDFCKLLKFFIMKGKNAQKEQILSAQTMEWLLSPKIPANNEMWLFGNDTANFMYPSASWCGGFAKFMPNSASLPFACGPNTYYWQCYFGMHYYFDTETGNYMVSGTQAPVCSWYLKNQANQDPNGITHNPSYEPNDLSLWRLTTMNQK